jgi:hypothetical protein
VEDGTENYQSQSYPTIGTPKASEFISARFEQLIDSHGVNVQREILFGLAHFRLDDTAGGKGQSSPSALLCKLLCKIKSVRREKSELVLQG